VVNGQWLVKISVLVSTLISNLCCQANGWPAPAAPSRKEATLAVLSPAPAHERQQRAQRQFINGCCWPRFQNYRADLLLSATTTKLDRIRRFPTQLAPTD
jgi:hypothetical protein